MMAEAQAARDAADAVVRAAQAHKEALEEEVNSRRTPQELAKAAEPHSTPTHAGDLPRRALGGSWPPSYEFRPYGPALVSTTWAPLRGGGPSGPGTGPGSPSGVGGPEKSVPGSEISPVVLVPVHLSR